MQPIKVINDTCASAAMIAKNSLKKASCESDLLNGLVVQKPF